VDGVSLTLVDVETDRFSVMLIPHTLGVTTLGGLQVGDRVNIEADMLAKHVAKLVEYGDFTQRRGDAAENAEKTGVGGEDARE
jgi:riboflavin synthase alpha subunit